MRATVITIAQTDLFQIAKISSLAGTGLTIHRSHRTRFPENHVLRSRTRLAPIIYDGIRNRSTKREKSE